jgi:hypothetical protein
MELATTEKKIESNDKYLNLEYYFLLQKNQFYQITNKE